VGSQPKRPISTKPQDCVLQDGKTRRHQAPIKILYQVNVYIVNGFLSIRASGDIFRAVALAHRSHPPVWGMLLSAHSHSVKSVFPEHALAATDARDGPPRSGPIALDGKKCFRVAIIKAPSMIGLNRCVYSRTTCRAWSLKMSSPRTTEIDRSCVRVPPGGPLISNTVWEKGTHWETILLRLARIGAWDKR